tara:strand:+ start:178 stop:300 length:123 start_codon:yes stop_codon:yes gene_type:complete
MRENLKNALRGEMGEYPPILLDFRAIFGCKIGPKKPFSNL